jgi:hypothetical protein
LRNSGCFCLHAYRPLTQDIVIFASEPALGDQQELPGSNQQTKKSQVGRAAQHRRSPDTGYCSKPSGTVLQPPVISIPACGTSSRRWYIQDFVMVIAKQTLSKDTSGCLESPCGSRKKKPNLLISRPCLVLPDARSPYLSGQIRQLTSAWVRCSRQHA